MRCQSDLGRPQPAGQNIGIKSRRQLLPALVPAVMTERLQLRFHIWRIDIADVVERAREINNIAGQGHIATIPAFGQEASYQFRSYCPVKRVWPS